MDTRWEIEHFRLFFVFLAAGSFYLGPESLNRSNTTNTEKQIKRYPKMTAGVGQHLRAKSKAENFGLFALYPFCFFICSLAAIWPTFGYYRGNSLTYPMLITALHLGYQFLAQS